MQIDMLHLLQNLGCVVPNEVDYYIIIMKLPYTPFSILPTFLRRWEIQTQLHKSFLP
jgi:hypothetical protein